MGEKTCASCWFAGMDLKTPDPHGPLRKTCMVLGKRRHGGCPGWEEDRPGSGYPLPRDIAVAEALMRQADARASA